MRAIFLPKEQKARGRSVPTYQVEPLPNQNTLYCTDLQILHYMSMHHIMGTTKEAINTQTEKFDVAAIGSDVTRALFDR